MKRISEPIVFFGSGPVAAESLRLLAQDFTIEAVVTKPRALHHKGNVPVLQLATELKLPFFTVIHKKGLDELVASHAFRSRVAILVDFGIIVSQKVIGAFPLGIINSHFSLLPEWRGADPITFSILSGQQETGISLMLLVEAMDEGPLLAQAPFSLPPTITTPELTEALIELSHEALRTVVPLYMAGNVAPQPQSPTIPPTYSRKLTKEDGLIDWNKPALHIEREVRAFASWPKSRTYFKDLLVIITKAHVVDMNGAAGTTTVHNQLPLVYCGEQALALDRLTPAGKKEMTGHGFVAGYKKFLT